MPDLSSRARALVQSARDLHRPTAEDRARVGRALELRLGATRSLREGQADGFARALRPRWPWISGAVIAAGLAGGALLIGAPGSESERPLTAHRPPTPSVSDVAPASSASREGSADPPLPLAPDPRKGNVSSIRPARDGLAEEVALLSRATSDLHASKPAAALAVLDEHQRKFPKGMLTQERRAARAQALCALGRHSEGQAELAQLARGSLAAARAKQACEAKAPKAP